MPFDSVHAIDLILRFEEELIGHVLYNDQLVSAVLRRKEKELIIIIEEIIDYERDETVFHFTSGQEKFLITAAIIERIHSFQDEVRSYSEGSVEYLMSACFEENVDSIYSAYYRTDYTSIIYGLFGAQHAVPLSMDDMNFSIGHTRGYITIKSAEQINDKIFTDRCYDIMIALGFLSGHFIQKEHYILQQKNDGNPPKIRYSTLRASTDSFHHAFTHQPYQCRYSIGDDYAEELREKKLLKPIRSENFSKLVMLIRDSVEVRYALVLFNDSNDDRLSLLIKNTCFFAVLEVLRKFFFDEFKHRLPLDYSQKGNVEKARLVFEQLIPIGQEERDILERRNAFSHGDIKELSDKERRTIMEKQITLIYRLMLTFIGFDGYAIDHYARRNGDPRKVFVKVN